MTLRVTTWMMFIICIVGKGLKGGSKSWDTRAKCGMGRKAKKGGECIFTEISFPV